MQDYPQIDNAIIAAGEFLASLRDRETGIDEVRRRYGLTSEQAEEAAKLGNALRCARAA